MEANTDTGAAGTTTTQTTDATAAAAATATADAVHPQVMEDLKKWKEKARALETQVKESQTKQMKEQQQWKELAELKEKEAKDASEQAEKLKTSFINEKKYSALKEACLKMGLRKEAESDLDIIDLSSIGVETTSTGKFNVLGVDTHAQRLKTLKPHWFEGRSGANVNTSSPRVSDSGVQVITAKEILEAEKEGRKTGDMSRYNELIKLKQQRR